PAGDRDAALLLAEALRDTGVRVREHGFDELIPQRSRRGTLFHELIRSGGVEAVGALAEVPAHIARPGDVVDLFPQVLTYVRNEQRAGLAVDAEAVGVAQPPEIDLGSR